MSNQTPRNPINILFVGTPGAFSRTLLLALDRPDVNIAGIVHRSNTGANNPIVRLSPNQRRVLPMANQTGGLLDNCPRYLVSDLDSPEALEMLAKTAPDLIVAGCFPRLVPRQIRKLATIAAVNVHPSLLPRHRGPDPIFWSFRHGDTETGVTVHLMNDSFDTGPILLQSSTAMDHLQTYGAIEASLATCGGALLNRLIANLPSLPVQTPQKSESASHEPLPASGDLTIDSTWRVEQAIKFVSGVAESHGPVIWTGDGNGSIRFRALAQGSSGMAIGLADGFIRISPLP